ncbi:MAG: TlpA disulfide reductase family protein [Phycisphaerae bacterium]
MMHWRCRIWVPVCLGMLSAPAALQAEDVDLAKLLKQVDEATKAVHAVTYHAEFFGEGEAKDMVPRLSGTVCGKAGPTERENKLRFEGTVHEPKSDDAREFFMATDGKTIYAIDKAKKSFRYGPMSAARDVSGGVQATALFMREFFHPTPFSDEINGDSEHEGTKKIGDVECDVVFVRYSGQDAKARWYFGREDHLPRRVDRIRGDGALVLEVTKLDSSPGLSQSTFRLEAPPGYEEKEFKASGGFVEPELLKVGDAAPNWELKTSGGKTVSLKSLRGQIVVLDFWATWCKPCKVAMPGLQKVHERFKGKAVSVFGVNIWESGEPADYMKKNDFSYGLLLEADDVADDYKVTGIPTFYVIGPDGKIIHASVGSGAEEELVEIIEKALKKA